MAQENNRKLKNRVRRSYVISTVSISLVLFLLGAVGYLILTAMRASDRMKESLTVYVMLKSDVDAPGAQKIGSQLAKLGGVREVKFVSKDAAAEDFKEYAGGDFVHFLDQNPLPDSFEVGVTAKASQTDSLAMLEKKIQALEGVDEIVYQRNVIEQITSNINKFNFVLILFGGSLLLISLILLNNTIRMSIFAKRYLINTMKLVGATQWFILRPFMGRAILQGFYAALIACAMFIGMVSGLNEGLPEIKFADDTINLVIILGAMLVGGIIISLTFTTFAVRKFVRMQTNKIHFY